jgi:hypothetical protein
LSTLTFFHHELFGIRLFAFHCVNNSALLKAMRWMLLAENKFSPILLRCYGRNASGHGFLTAALTLKFPPFPFAFLTSSGALTYKPRRQQRHKRAQAHNSTPYRRQQSFM